MSRNRRTRVIVKVGDGQVTLEHGSVRLTGRILNPEPPAAGDVIILDRLLHEPDFDSDTHEFRGCYVTELHPKKEVRNDG